MADFQGTNADESYNGQGLVTGAEIRGNGGDDFLKGAGQGDLINGGGGNDTLRGGNGDDTINGGLGEDKLSGGNGDDSLRGGEGDDALHGGAGVDRLRGGEGSDRLNGGDGADFFIFGAPDSNGAGDVDTIVDFEDGVDKIILQDLTYTSIADGNNGRAIVTLSDGSQIVLLGVSASQLTADDFITN